MSSKEESKMQMLIAREGFLELLNNNLDTSCLNELAAKNNMTLDYLMYLILYYKKRYVEPCPTSEERLKYQELSKLNKKRQRGMICKEIFETLVADYFSPQAVNALAEKHNCSSYKVMLMAKEYLNGKYVDIGIVPKEEDKKYLGIPNLSQVWNAKVSKDIFERLLNDDYAEKTIEELCSLYVMDRRTLLYQVRKYINGEYEAVGFKPTAEELAKKERLTESMPARKIRIGKKAFESLIQNAALTYSLSSIMEEEKIDFITICKYIDEYRKRVVEPMPSREEELIYKMLMGQSYDQEFIESLSHLNYDALEKMANDYNLECLLAKIPQMYNSWECSKERAERLKTLEQELRKIMDNFSKNPKTISSKNLAQIVLKEYLNGTEYDVATIIKRIGKNNDSFKIKKHLFENANTGIYQAYLEEKQKRLDKFLILINDIYEKNQANARYSILDLALDIDTTLEDFISFYSAEKKIFFRFHNGVSVLGIEGFFGKLLTRYVSVNAKVSPEILDGLEYFYNGKKLTKELKDEIASFLTSKNIPVSREMICLCFEKYVRGEIQFSYQI